MENKSSPDAILHKPSFIQNPIIKKTIQEAMINQNLNENHGVKSETMSVSTSSTHDASHQNQNQNQIQERRNINVNQNQNQEPDEEIECIASEEYKNPSISVKYEETKNPTTAALNRFKHSILPVPTTHPSTDTSTADISLLRKSILSTSRPSQLQFGNLATLRSSMNQNNTDYYNSATTPSSVSMNMQRAGTNAKASNPLNISPPKPMSIDIRKDSFTTHDELLSLLHHTPPSFSPSLTHELPVHKKIRNGSISHRLRSASDLEDRGVIDRYQKGVLKDLIISGDETFQKALEKFEEGDSTALEALLESGTLNRKHSLDLLEVLDLNYLNVNPANSAYEPPHKENLEEWDDVRFDQHFIENRDMANNQLNMHGNDVSSHQTSVFSSSIGLPSLGLGLTPPPNNPFGLVDDFLENRYNIHNEHHEFSNVFSNYMAPPNQANFSNEYGILPSQQLSGPPTTSVSACLSSPLTSHKAPYTRPIHIPGRPKDPNSMNTNTSMYENNYSRPASSTNNGVSSNAHMHGDPSATHLHVPDDKKKRVGAYSPDSRRKRIEQFLEKRQNRVWTKKVKYDVRKNFADSRLRVKGRFVKKEDEQLLRELLSFT